LGRSAFLSLTYAAETWLSSCRQAAQAWNNEASGSHNANPVEIELTRGHNVLKFTHKSVGAAKGITLKQFTLTPAS